MCILQQNKTREKEREGKNQNAVKQNKTEAEAFKSIQRFSSNY